MSDQERIVEITRAVTGRLGFDDIEESKPGSTDRVAVRSAIALGIKMWRESEERRALPEPEPLAERAARAVAERLRIGIELEGSPLSALGWAMGVHVSYEDAMRALVDEAIRLHDEEDKPLSFVHDDVVVSHFKDDAGKWTHIELTEDASTDEVEEEWRTVVSLLLSDTEAADVAMRMLDRSALS